jgi:DNA repair exonuclease SbcCD ATPase subunit
MTNNSPEIDDSDITRNVDWKLKSFEFDNMFSYGVGSKIDFTKLDGVIGLVAPNHSGKSALMDAIAYTIFDVCSRTNRALDVKNKKKASFKAKLNLEINGEDYWIERIGTQKVVHHKDGTITESCPVSVKFYMIDGDDEIDLSGAARFNSQYGSGTNEEIGKILGSFDDFILTSLSLQNNGTDFVDKKQAERKQILSQFMDIDIFEQLETIARSDSNEERALLKTFKKKDNYKDLSTINQHILDYEKTEKEFTTKTQELEDEIDKLEDIKFKLGTKLHTVDSTILHIDDLNYEKGKKELDKTSKEKSLVEDKEYKETLRPLFNEYNEKLNKFNEDEIKSNYETFNKLKAELKDIENSMKLNESKTNALIRHKDDLDKYKYDENCEFCIKNGEEQINEQQSIQTQLKDLHTDFQVLSQNENITKDKFESVSDAEENLYEFDRFSDEISQIRHDAVKIAGKITTQESEIKQLEAEILNINVKITQHYENVQKIQDNERYNSEIKDCISEITELNTTKRQIGQEYKQVIGQLNMYKSEKHTIERDIKKLVETEQMILDYDLYLMALSKDGVPYELISKTIPAIENEVNQVLDNMMVGFNLKLTMDGKNIETMICYEDNCWNLELSSGMEKFVSSLAIRVGLINISTLPRPNFLVIDEGFGSLDGDNIANMEGAFQYLKTQFDFVMIVSHLDTIKDYMDMLIPIEINKNLSKITFT